MRQQEHRAGCIGIVGFQEALPFGIVQMGYAIDRSGRFGVSCSNKKTFRSWGLPTVAVVKGYRTPRSVGVRQASDNP
jgi:hypothetical protein